MPIDFTTQALPANPLPMGVRSLGGDSTLPTITGAGATIGPTDPVVVTVADETSLAATSIVVEFPTAGDESAFVLGVGFGSAYNAASGVVDNLDGSFTYTIERDDGWPGDFSLRVVAADGGGNTAVEALSFVVTGSASALPSNPLASGRGDGNVPAIEDICSDAFDVLLSQYSDKPRMRALICALVTPMQVIDDSMSAMRSLDIATAAGDQLTRIAEIVGLARSGRSDFDLRLATRVQIAVNTSAGKIDEIVALVRLVLDTPAEPVRLYNRGAKAYSVEVDQVLIDPNALVATLASATDAGARAAVLHTGVAKSGRLLLGRATQFGDATAQGLGSVTQPVGTGGAMASYRVDR